MTGAEVPRRRVSDVAPKELRLPPADIEDGPKFTLSERHDPKVPSGLRRELVREGFLLGALTALVVVMTLVTFGLAIAVVVVDPVARPGVLIALVTAVFTLAGIVFPLYFHSSRSNRRKR